MTLREFQKKIEDIYIEKDSARGTAGTFMWFTEEVGELARAIKGGDAVSRREEFADVAAWLFSLASICEIDKEEAVGKYAEGCPKCRATPCHCR